MTVLSACYCCELPPVPSLVGGGIVTHGFKFGRRFLVRL